MDVKEVEKFLRCLAVNVVTDVVKVVLNLRAVCGIVVTVICHVMTNLVLAMLGGSPLTLVVTNPTKAFTTELMLTAVLNIT